MATSPLNSKVMMALGRYRFALRAAAYQSLTRKDGWRWSEAERLGRAPALQYLGPSASEITLEGVIYPHFKGGLGQIQAMRDEADGGAPLLMVDGLGFVWGPWAITDIQERASVFFADGAPRQQDFTLSLKAYGADA